MQVYIMKNEACKLLRKNVKVMRLQIDKEFTWREVKSEIGEREIKKTKVIFGNGKMEFDICQDIKKQLGFY